MVMKKVSFRVRSFDKEQFLTYNIDNEACLDEEVLDFIEDEEPKGIVSVIFEEGEEFDTFSYNITDRIHISELANQEINAEMVLKVLHSLVLTLIDMAEYRIPLSYLVLHRDYIYVDSDYRIEFICIPLEEMKEDVDLNAFLRSYLANIRYDISEDCSYVAKLFAYVNNMAVFNLRNMITLIEEVMEDMGIEIPEEASAEIYADYQEVVEEELADAEELPEEEVLEEDMSEETEPDTDIKEEAEESALKLASAPEEEEAEEEGALKLASVPEEDEETEAGENEEAGDSENQLSDGDETDEGENRKPIKNSLFSLKEPEPDEDDLIVEEEETEESPVEAELEEELSAEEESEEEFSAEEELAEKSLVEEQSEAEPFEEADSEASDVAEDELEDLVEPEESEELEESENEDEREVKAQRKPIFKTKDTAVTGVVIEDDFDEFLAEKERQEQLEHQEESSLKIKKNIKVNRASLVKNTQDEKSEDSAEENDTKANEGGEEEEQTAASSILSQTLGATGILKGAATPPKVNPYLIRTNTKERIMITKQNFKLGKASMGVDYTIKGNGAVSRTHAIITNKDGVYYIKDNKSTNHTYVNNKMVPDGESAELKQDCKIVLGDEEFTFKMQ